MRTPVAALPDAVCEELDLLQQVQQGALRDQADEADPNYYDDILELRDSLSEAHPEDLPALTTQIEQLVLLAQRQQERTPRNRSFHWHSPYFAHMRLQEQGKTRDLLLGNQNFFSGHLSCSIVDWKKAPVSQIFYRYQEEEEYIEELGGREVEGRLLLRRLVRIEDGVLRSVSCPQGTWFFEDGQWFQWEQTRIELSGGSGSATRPIHEVGPYRLDKHLPQITALIDERQFEIISQPEAGVILIQGGAGSGKTTVALHRLAYLMTQKPNYFNSNGILPIVFNRALAQYISKLLPSLGVDGVEARVFQEWVAQLRQRFFPDLPSRYAEKTPVRVIEFKRSPVILAWCAKELEHRLERFQATLMELFRSLTNGGDVITVWNSSANSPVTDRLSRLLQWTQGQEAFTHLPPMPDSSIRQRIDRLVEDWFPDVLKNPQALALQLWNDALIQRRALQEAITDFAPGSFSESQLDEIWSWNVRCYQRRQVIVGERVEEDGETPEGWLENQSLSDELPTLDEEDDTLLLLLYQLTTGPLRGRKNKLLQYHHLLVDEVQDFSIPELQLLLSMTPPERRSVTLAGDMDQRILAGNRYQDWDTMLQALSVEVTAMEPLTIGYRSTYEIMEVARHVIGHLSVNTVWEATRHGAPVERFGFQHPGVLIAFLVDSLGSLLRREPSASVVVLTRELPEARKIAEQLERAEIPGLRLVADQDFSFRAGVEVTDISQTKGLEFDYVLLVDADASTYGPDDLSRHLLYVGITRAAHQLWLLHCGNPSSLLPDTLR
ncbi:MAG: ATP-binding domain-containing protein [bacterium]